MASWPFAFRCSMISFLRSNPAWSAPRYTRMATILSGPTSRAHPGRRHTFRNTHCRASTPIVVPMYPVNGQAAAPAVRVSPGSDAVRHPWEIPLLVLAVLTTVVTYVVAIVLIAAGDLSTWILVVLAAPILLFLARGQLYGSQQVNGIKMTPSQFPEGYQLVAEAGAR